MILNEGVLLTPTDYISVSFFLVIKTIFFSITQGTTNVQPREGLEIEPAVNLFMNILTTNAKQKHTQGKLNVIM